jgi:hypothetical protein
MDTPPFLPGLELSRRFYFEAVRPILDRHFPGLAHSAALIGYGSEVLGLDTPMSMDHNWHPRVLLFLPAEDLAQAQPIRAALSRHLPHLFLGIPVDAVPVPEEPGTRWMAFKADGEVEHVIDPTTLREFVQRVMAWDLTQALEVADWLGLPSQVLRELTGGEVFHDSTGELTRLREELAWYPHDVWLYLLACGWNTIENDEHLMPRAGFVGDELGSALIGGRLAHQVMRQCYLMEKRYAPYPKWFGADFQRLGCAEQMTPLLRQVRAAQSWQARQAAFGQACLLLAQMHNRLALTPPLAEELSNFHGRPFRVIHSDNFANALREQIQNPQVTALAARGLIGGIDQFSDNTELKSNIAVWRERVKELYRQV